MFIFVLLYNYYGDNMKLKIRTWVKVLFLLIVIFSCTFIYGKYIEPKNIVIREYNIINSKIPSSFYGLKIVHISDIHYKVTTNKKDLKKLVKEINLMKPDIVILSGDIFDSNIEYTEDDFKDLTDILKSIDYSIGKYAIKGEEDLKFKAWTNIINDSNFINLNDSYEFIYNGSNEPLLLVGVSSNYNDNHIEKFIDNTFKEIKDEYKYAILVLHEPDFVDKIDYSKFNLILAGHSHNGQVILPFIGPLLNDKYSKNYYSEYYKLGNTKLYVSSGIGCSKKLKFRLFSKPSINLYRLRNN